MSRHSHWAKIKHGKGAADVKKGAIFTKLARSITVAAREKGPDPNFNFKLRLAIDQARASNMPKDNIDRAIARATGEGADISLEELLYEGILPGGVGTIIEATSDNKNRTTNEVKKILSDFGGTMAGGGAVSWNFLKLGVIGLSPEEPREKEDLELKLIDAGAEEIKDEDGEIHVYTKPENLEKMKNALENDKIKIEFAGLEWVPKERIEVDSDTRKKLDELFLALDESEEVSEYYTNLA